MKLADDERNTLTEVAAEAARRAPGAEIGDLCARITSNSHLVARVVESHVRGLVPVPKAAPAGDEKSAGKGKAA